MPSSRAIRRCDQPRWCNVKMLSMSAIVYRHELRRLLLHSPGDGLHCLILRLACIFGVNGLLVGIVVDYSCDFTDLEFLPGNQVELFPFEGEDFAVLVHLPG